MKKDNLDLMDKIISLAKRRGFIFPGSEIYGGLANSWDYGPLGVELKNNIKKLWWKMFVQQRDDIVGIDAALIMNPKVWEASGHLLNFNDPLIECKKCHQRYRETDMFTQDDHYVGTSGLESHYKETLAKRKKEFFNKGCPNCGSKDFTEAKQFNLMFKTFMGPVDPTNELARAYIKSEWANLEDISKKPSNDEIVRDLSRAFDELEKSTVYLRPETAQAIFVDFKQILETTRKKLPFGVAQIGKAFRNEITPGNFIFRQREFEQMEIEYFINSKDWKKYFELWLEQQKLWIKAVGIDESKTKYVEISPEDRAHYSKRSIDTEFVFPFGQKELYGLAYRTNFDLSNHENMSGQSMKYKDPQTGEEFIPHVIEPTWGVDRTVLAVLLSTYSESEARSGKEDAVHETEITLRLPKELAPIKIAVLPLSKKDELTKPAAEILRTLQKHWIVQYDETGSIGKRYRRQDEIGTPYCVTLDFETANDKSVTVRDRDTMQQERIKIEELTSYFKEKLDF